MLFFIEKPSLKISQNQVSNIWDIIVNVIQFDFSLNCPYALTKLEVEAEIGKTQVIRS